MTDATHNKKPNEATHECLASGCKARITTDAFCWDHLPGGDAERAARLRDATTYPIGFPARDADETHAEYRVRLVRYGADENQARIEGIIEAELAALRKRADYLNDAFNEKCKELVRANADVANCCDKRDDLGDQVFALKDEIEVQHQLVLSLVGERDVLRAELSDMYSIHRETQDERDDLEAGLERMRPVVEAAVGVKYECSDAFCDDGGGLCSLCRMRSAIAAYRAASSEQERHYTDCGGGTCGGELGSTCDACASDEQDAS